MISSNEAARIILEKYGKPLQYKELTTLILAETTWSTEGKTPDATINARLSTDIKEKGVASIFQRVGPSTFALRSWGLPEFSSKKITPKPKVTTRSETLPVPKTMTFNDAAFFILDKYGNRQPMHYEKITEKILELDLVNTEGRTPSSTLYAQILSEIKRYDRRGDTPRFVKHGKGMVSLYKWLRVGLASQIDAHNLAVRKKLHKRLFDLDPIAFENLVGELLVAIGFENVVVTKRSGDGGIDVRAVLVVGDVIKTNMAIQVKKWKNNIQTPIVQNVRGSLKTHEQGLIITTSNFSAGAYVEAQIIDKIPVALMNGEQLVSLLVENNIGITRTARDLIDLIDENIDHEIVY
jgi:restriction system protein